MVISLHYHFRLYKGVSEPSTLQSQVRKLPILREFACLDVAPFRGHRRNLVLSNAGRRPGGSLCRAGLPTCPVAAGSLVVKDDAACGP